MLKFFIGIMSFLFMAVVKIEAQPATADNPGHLIRVVNYYNELLQERMP
jgi:hypothetical protein